MRELALWQFIARHLKNDAPVMLLVVAESLGSSPGRAGFKMAVAPDGGLCGSIGGGIMEVKLVELAKVRLRAALGEGLLKKQIHRKSAPQHQSGMICSGEQTVLFYCLQKSQLASVKTALRCLKQQSPVYLRITQQYGFQEFTIKKGALERACAFEQSGEHDFQFEENLGFKNRLYIVGGGHCALALSEIMSKMDFYIGLFDDRPDLNTLHKNRFVHKKQVIENYDHIGRFIPEGPDVYVVVMTLGYRSDAAVLRQLAGKDFRYLGVLGSAAKTAVLLENLRAEQLSPEKTDRIRAPVGVNIRSHTPEEIAVSIAAELIAVKNAPGA